MLKKIKEAFLRVWTYPMVTRAVHTFWQSFLAMLVVSLLSVHSFSDLQVVVGAALAAGLSALKTFLLSLATVDK